MTEQLNIELRKIQHVERLSEETNCYVAQVWVDGKHMVDVSNEGHGGPDNQHPAKGFTYADVEALNDRCKWEFPAKTYYGMTIESDLEQVCGDLLTRWLIERDIKRTLRNAVCFTLQSKKGVYTVKKRQRGHAFSDGEIIARLQQRHGDDLGIIINQLAIADAVKTWQQFE